VSDDTCHAPTQSAAEEESPTQALTQQLECRAKLFCINCAAAILILRFMTELEKETQVGGSFAGTTDVWVYCNLPDSCGCMCSTLCTHG
jgi:hypothetical protein